MAFANKLRTMMIAAALAVPMATLPVAQAHAGVFISVGFAPPALPVYAQPVCPGDGYMWTPGYWAYDADGGYYWVPGTWVLPPESGVLWTPPYWGFADGVYGFHEGYWGPHVGFYGGINYGFGYGGVGFEGGYWNGGHFFYNTAVVRFGVGFHPAYVYSRPFVPMNHSTVAFNGPGGITARATPQEVQAMHEQHLQPTASQISHRSFAAQDRSQFASANHGAPTVRAAATPASFRSNPANHDAATRPDFNQQQVNRGQNAAGRPAGNENRTASTQPRAQAAPRARPAPKGKPAPKDDRR